METHLRSLEYKFKPKVSGKPAPARVERWLLWLQEYDFAVIYRPGTQNLADALSRLLNKTLRSNMESCADRYIHYPTEQLTPAAINTAEIIKYSEANPVLTQVRQCIENNQTHSKLWWPNMDKLLENQTDQKQYNQLNSQINLGQRLQSTYADPFLQENMS